MDSKKQVWRQIVKDSENSHIELDKMNFYLQSHLRVLHVDNDNCFLEITKRILESDGRIEVDSTLSVEEAFAKLRKQTYHVIVSDYEMPNEDGLQFLRRFKNENQEIPFIIFTGKGKEEVVIKALNLGAFRYINKHGDTETVYAELSNSIKQAAEYVKAQYLLKESEKRYHELFASTKEGIAVHEILYDNQGKPKDYIILDVNPSFESIIGIKKEKAVGKKATELYGETEAPYLDIYAKTAITGQYQRFETYFNPMKKYFSINVFSPSKDKFATIFVDISQNKEKEIALRNSLYTIAEKEERWATTLSSIGDAVIATDVNGKITFMNKIAEKLTGWELSEAENKALSQFFRIINEFTHKEIENPVDKILKSNMIVGLANHTLLIRKDGVEIPIDDSGAPIKDELGKITGVVLVFRDITDRKKSEDELRRSKTNLEIMNEKLMVVGGLTRHDIRNKLSVIVGNSFILKKTCTQQPEIIEKIDKIDGAVKEINKILEFTKIYEQAGVEELVLLNVGKLFDEATAQFPELNFGINNNCYGLTVLADSFLRQLFYNLIDNTIKHSIKATTINVYYEENNSGTLKIKYDDDGVGISTENKKHLYEAGFSTGTSTGYGLYFSKKMIDIYGWSIQEIGEPEKGVKFVITIPKKNKEGRNNYLINSKNGKICLN